MSSWEGPRATISHVHCGPPAHPRDSHGENEIRARPQAAAEEGWVNQCSSVGVCSAPHAYGSRFESCPVLQANAEPELSRIIELQHHEGCRRPLGSPNAGSGTLEYASADNDFEST